MSGNEIKSEGLAQLAHTNSNGLTPTSVAVAPVTTVVAQTNASAVVAPTEKKPEVKVLDESYHATIFFYKRGI